MTDSGKKKFGLKKSQILRGFDAYKNVLANSRLYSTDLLVAYVNKERQPGSSDINSEKIDSPLIPSGLIQKIKVGFIVSKKKIKKAVTRNYGKRLLKEAYRLSRHSTEQQSQISSSSYNIIFGFSVNGIERLKNKNIDFADLKDEMRILLEKIIK
jgi:ribonuclease P protein component